MKINVPTSWNDITVNQYQAFSQIDRETYSDDLSYTTAVLQVLCDLDSMVQLPLAAIEELAPHVKFLSEPLPTEKYEQMYIDGKDYEWINSFNAITVGEAISIELPIDLEELTFAMSYDVVLAVMLREKGKGFDSKEFDKNRERFGSLPIIEVVGMLLFFLNGGKTSTAHTKTYSIRPMRTKIIQRKRSKLKKLYDKMTTPILNGWRWLTS